MCGLIGGALPPGAETAALAAITHRGPDGQGLARVGRWALGHTRLAIQDLSQASAQPYRSGPLTVTYNGEQWRPDLLPGNGAGDTPRVAALLAAGGLGSLPRLARGMFALAWADERDGSLTLARDTYGEVPLHVGAGPTGPLYASEVSALLAVGAQPSSIRWLPPGTWLRFEEDGSASSGAWSQPHDLSPQTPHDPVTEVREHLARGVADRMRSDRPVAVLASGGLDSTAILTILAAAAIPTVAYTAVGDPGSADLRHARIITSTLGIPLTEVRVPEPNQAALMAAVRACEQPHKAQVEITLGCLALADALTSDGFAVVLSGEGSDELWASYGMAYHGIQAKGWSGYRYESFTGQHRKNFARTNKVFMSRGIEARLPFLDDGLVRSALRYPEETVRITSRRHVKAILASAVESYGLIPAASIWRAKEAFQTAAALDVAAARTLGGTRPATAYRRMFTETFQGAPA